MKITLPSLSQRRTKPLRPAGYNAFAEGMVQPIIALGSTGLSIIAAYVLAQTQVLAVISGTATINDILILILVAILGVMVDTCMVISSSRFSMHIARGRSDALLAGITGLMLLLCLVVEAMTLMYFGYLYAPTSLPPGIVDAVKSIHDILFFVRNLMPPLIIAFFTTALRPMTIEAADRDRWTKASTSINIAALQQDLMRLSSVATREEKLIAIQDQLAWNAYASHASPAEIERNHVLIDGLRHNPPVNTSVPDVEVHEEAQQPYSRVNPDVQKLSPVLNELLLGRSGA